MLGRGVNISYSGANTEAPFAIIAPSGCVLAVNAAFCHICQKSTQEILAVNILALVDFPDSQAMRQGFHSLHELSRADPTLGLKFKGPLKIQRSWIGMPCMYDLVVKRSPARFSGQLVLEATIQPTALSDVACVPVLPPSGNNLIAVDPQVMRSALFNYNSLAAMALRSVNLVQPKRILLVDDAYSSLKVMTDMISRLGQEVHTAKNGREALDMLLQHRYDLVVMDLYMPLMDGIQASSKYRQFEGSTSQENRQKMIAISGTSSDSVENEVGEAGFDKFIRKPLTLDTFRTLILETMAENRAQLATPAEVLADDNGESSKDDDHDESEGSEDDSGTHSKSGTHSRSTVEEDSTTIVTNITRATMGIDGMDQAPPCVPELAAKVMKSAAAEPQGTDVSCASDICEKSETRHESRKRVFSQFVTEGSEEEGSSVKDKTTNEMSDSDIAHLRSRSRVKG